MKTPEYTTGEIFLLKSFLEPYPDANPAIRALEQISIDEVDWLQEGDKFKSEIDKLNRGYSMSWLLYEAPFEKMPLFINHTDMYYRGIAKFRLRVGK